jgi:hypothetical protein
MTSQYGSRGPTGRVAGKVPGYDSAQVQQFTPEQMQLFQSIFSHLQPGSYTSRLAGGDQSLFGEMEAPAMRQFAGLQGDLASRFSGMGMGARRSSGFQNTANQASADFAQGLQSRRQELQRQAIQDLVGMSGQLLGQRPSENFLVPEKPSFLQSLLGALGHNAGAITSALSTQYGLSKF